MTALVGPLQPVRYANGPTQWHDLPRDTVDIRYSACGNHHLACDCREALLAENENEYRAMYREAEDVILAAIKGHQTYAYTMVGELGTQVDDDFAVCKCSACGIARAARIGFGQAMRDQRAAYQRLADAEAERLRAWCAAEYPDLEEVPF